MFILNAALAALAAVIAYFMIHHKELIREDDEQRKAEGRLGIQRTQIRDIETGGAANDNPLVEKTMPENVEKL